MESSELRIGIWLKSNTTGTYFQVKADDIPRLSRPEFLLTNPPKPIVSPIPLTPEWALKFGFKKTDRYEYTIELMKGLVKLELAIIPGTSNCPITVYNHVGQCITLRSVEYVHDLQNYVFGFLRIELTLSVPEQQNL